VGDPAKDDNAAGRDTGEPDAEKHDPTGLDLARRVAAQFRGTAGRITSRPARKQRRYNDPAQFSGAHPDERDPAPLGTAVERLVSDSGWSTEVSVHTVLGRWPQIVGPDVALHCKPVSYTDGVVAVTADSTAWATQLTLLAATVVARLNAELGDGTVVRIQVSGPGGPTWKRGRRSVRDGRGPRDTYG
jgi:predicted nucleic acid-binding Zn ribbon protein